MEKPKHPGRVEGGRMGARRRWGPPRTVRLDDFDPSERAFLLALLDAARKAKVKPDTDAA